MKIFYILSITLIILIATFLAVGCYLDIKSKLDNDWNYITSLNDEGLSIRDDTVISEDTSDPIVSELGRPALTIEVNNDMLDYVIQCESSGNMKAIGKEGEIGILQWKTETWEYLSKKLKFEGDIYNEQDQIDFFLLAIDNGFGNYWTCFRKWETKN